MDEAASRRLVHRRGARLSEVGQIYLPGDKIAPLGFAKPRENGHQTVIEAADAITAAEAAEARAARADYEAKAARTTAERIVEAACKPVSIEVRNGHLFRVPAE